MTNDEFIFNFLGVKKEDLELEEDVFNVVSQAFRSGYNLGKIDANVLHQKKIFELNEKHQQKMDYILEEMKKLNKIKGE